VSYLDLETALTRAREVAEDVLAPDAQGVDREARWPEEGIRALQAAGLGGLVVPVDLGGCGHGLSALAQVCEIIGGRCASAALCFGMHCVGSAVIAAHATDDQRERYLVPIGEGRHFTSLSLSEPGTGAHFYLPETLMRSVSSDCFTLSGTKSFVTNGGCADSYVVSAVKEAEGTPPGEFSCVVVSGDAPGVEWGSPWDGLGMRGNASRTMELKDVQVARADLLGREGDQIWYVFNVIAPYFLMAMAGTYVGISDAALEATTAHMKQRSHSHTGRALADVSVLQHRLGRLWSDVQRSRAMVLRAGQAFDADEPGAVSAVMSAKADVSESAVQVVGDALSLCGGIAYRGGGTLDRLMRDVRAAHVMSPTTDILRVWTGRFVLGLPLLGE